MYPGAAGRITRDCRGVIRGQTWPSAIPGRPSGGRAQAKGQGAKKLIHVGPEGRPPPLTRTSANGRQKVTTPGRLIPCFCASDVGIALGGPPSLRAGQSPALGNTDPFFLSPRSSSSPTTTTTTRPRIIRRWNSRIRRSSEGVFAGPQCSFTNAYHSRSGRPRRVSSAPVNQRADVAVRRAAPRPPAGAGRNRPNFSTRPWCAPLLTPLVVFFPPRRTKTAASTRRVGVGLSRSFGMQLSAAKQTPRRCRAGERLPPARRTFLRSPRPSWRNLSGRDPDHLPFGLPRWRGPSTPMARRPSALLRAFLQLLLGNIGRPPGAGVDGRYPAPRPALDPGLEPTWPRLYNALTNSIHGYMTHPPRHEGGQRFTPPATVCFPPPRTRPPAGLWPLRQFMVS